jgi:hypothetical protein
MATTQEIVSDIKEQYPILDEDFEKRAEERLSNQFKESTKMVDTIKIYQKQLMYIKDAILELLTERWLDNATGINLDYIGEWVDQPRLSLLFPSEVKPRLLNDDEYRSFIKVKTFTNKTKSINNDLYYQISNVLNRNDFYIESRQAQVKIYFESTLTDYQIYLFNLKWTDVYGQERLFFEITLGVGFDVYDTLGNKFFGYGDKDYGYGVGFYARKVK